MLCPASKLCYCCGLDGPGSGPGTGTVDVISRRILMGGMIALGLAACGRRERNFNDEEANRVVPGGSPELRRMIEEVAREHDVPVALVHRVVRRESTYNPRARNGIYMGLMQIAPQTARVMGYRGEPEGLLDARTNLTYGVKYLRGAWLLSNGSHDRAVHWYSRGYYYEAKRRGMLREVGLKA